MRNLSVVILCIAILIILLIEIILNLTPPIDRDALIHHLAIPKLWLKNGGFYEIKWAGFSYFPMNIDLLYLIPIYFNKDFIAKFIHMGFGLGTALLIFFYLKKRISLIGGLLGILVFLSTPMIFRLSTEAYVDLGLIFFTTAAILAFVRYRDGEFKEFKWLFFSSVAMGLALGTKYNALIAWCFLTAAIIFIYSRNTGEQWKAIKCGLIFFLISLLIFSPWLIKNMILTGNPFYPLLQGFFNIDTSPTQDGTISTLYGGTYSGIFQMRSVMFGEGFWETLLIPIRYFFQGQDNNDRYFDGVLNPILIILPSFAFINKSFYRDKLFFAGFIVFFILTATFLDQTRIRYILPVVPILSILSVMGFTNILHWTMSRSNQLRYILAAVFISVFIIFMIPNIIYIKTYYQKICPMNYVSGKESRDDFISRHVGSYPAVKYINDHTPENSRIMLILLADRGYYLDRAYESTRQMGIIHRIVAASSDDKTFRIYIRSLGYTHLLVRTDLFQKYLQDNYPEETIENLFRCLARETEMIYQKGGYGVYRIIPSR